MRPKGPTTHTHCQPWAHPLLEQSFGTHIGPFSTSSFPMAALARCSGVTAAPAVASRRRQRQIAITRASGELLAPLARAVHMCGGVRSHAHQSMQTALPCPGDTVRRGGSTCHRVTELGGDAQVFGAVCQAVRSTSTSLLPLLFPSPVNAPSRAPLPVPTHT